MSDLPPKINLSILKTLYGAREIKEVWQSHQHLAIIAHPTHGLISPKSYRAMYHGKPCPYCAQKMVHGKSQYTTKSQEEALKRGYQYTDKQGKKKFFIVDRVYFHPRYVTLDHKLNKARFPEKMFDYDNLQVVCWQCNDLKSDDNSFDLQHTQDYLDSLAAETLNRYPLL